MKAALEMKTSVTERNFNDILEEENMDTLMHGDVVVKVESGELPCGRVGSGLPLPGQSSSWIEEKKP